VMLNTETYFLLDIFVRQILVEPELKIFNHLNMMEISQHNLFEAKCTKRTTKDLNPDKPEITNYKHQITIFKSQIRSKANCLEF
jgi:hypothetical protein